MATITTHDNDSGFRYLDPTPELQKLVLEKYFGDNEFILRETADWNHAEIPIHAVVYSKYNIVNLLVVSHAFQKRALAAM